MLMSLNNLMSGIILITGFKYASSILCYDCNSAYDPRCGEQFDPFSLGIVNCSLRDPPEHIEQLPPTICRSIKMDIYGKIRIVRTCGYIHDEPGKPTCQRQSGNGDLFVTYCSCDSDLCNAASSIELRKMALVVGLIFWLLK